jgi:undecaprenyl-diphosphatase
LNLNSAIFDAINDLAGHVSVADRIMEFGANYGVYLVVGIVVLSWFIHRGNDEDRRLAFYTAVVSMAVALLIAKILQHYYVHPRPFVARHDVELLVSHAPDASFPSEHATGAFALAAGIGLYRARFGFVLLVLAMWIAFARVFVGIHYPGDVAGGAAIGILVALMIWYLRPLLAWIDRTIVVRFVPALIR